MRKIHVVSRIDGGVARQQQLDDFNVTLRGGDVQGGLQNSRLNSRMIQIEVRSGDVQGGLFAEGTENQKQMSEARHNRTSAVRFQSTMQV